MTKMQGPLLHLFVVVALYSIYTLGAPTAAPVTVVSLGANLTEVIGAAVPGEKFHLASGSYSISQTIKILVPISITSFGSTTISCNGTHIGLEANDGLSMDSVTVTGCTIGVSSLNSSNPSTFTNCQFTSNVIATDVSAQVYVINCTYTGNACALGITNTSAYVERSTFAYNIAPVQRAGAIVALNSALTLVNSTLYGNQGFDGGAIYVSDGTVNITLVTAYGNSATNGAVAYFTGNSKIQIYTAKFTQNWASHSGGAVYTTVDVSFINGQLMNNSAAVNGGAMYIITGALMMAGVDIKNNTAVNGGALYFSTRMGSHLTANTFTSNSATTGGAIYGSNSFILTLASDFYRNNATIGGAVYMSPGTVFLMNTGYTSDNTAANGGFAVFEECFGTIYRLNSTRNAASSFGGAFYVDGGDVRFNDMTLDNNTAQDSGGGVYAVQARPVFSNVNFVNHYAGVRGGAICATGGNISINISTAISNFANTEGGAIALLGVNAAYISNTNFSFNEVLNNGAAVSVSGGVVAFTNAQFVTNNAMGSGGAVYALQGNLNFVNSLLTGNVAMFGGGVSTVRSNVSLVSSRTLENKAGMHGGALELVESPLYISNCSISSNQATVGGGLWVQTSFLEITFSIITNNFASSAASAIYVNNVTALSLLADNIIEGTNTNSSSGMWLISDKNLLHIRNSLINVNLTSLVFCCSGKQLMNPQGAFCNYPVCDAQCSEAKGCTCPFVSPPIIIATPVLPRSYSNCTCVNGGVPANLCTVPSRCPFGFNQTESGCIEVNECASPTACDSRTTCTNTIGGYSCTPCPRGFIGDPRVECSTLCGDGVCDSTVGENCVTCTEDCKQLTCGACGDGVCDSGESCSSCYADCGSCKPPTCKNECSSHGTCVGGVCQCTGSWTGPTCSTNNQPIDFEPNKTTPIAGGSVRTVLFSVAVRTLIERDASGAIVSQLGLDPREHNFTFVESPLFGSSANTMWTYSTVLSNSAIVNITFISFQEASTQYTFANKTSAYSANTLKVNLRVSQWPFRGISNILQVAMETDAKGGEQEVGCVPVTSASTDAEGNLLWVKVTVNSVAFYGQFVPYSVVDGRTRSVQFSLNSNDKSDKMVYATLPHFWNSAEFDPSYTVLIDPTDQNASCGRKSKSDRTLIIAVAASVAGVALILGAIAFVIMLRKRRITHDRLEMKSRSNTAT